MIKGFKDFLFRGNIVDLAVAVVIGVAFTDLVKVFTESFIKPIINLVMGGGVGGGQWRVDGQVLDFGAFINGVITFVVTAAVVYFIFVLPMKTLIERAKRGEVPAPTVIPEDVKLLGEIRDLLANRAPGSGPTY